MFDRVQLRYCSCKHMCWKLVLRRGYVGFRVWVFRVQAGVWMSRKALEVFIP